MIAVQIGTNDKGQYDIRVLDGSNGKLLLFSHQGYENAVDAEAVVARVFDRPDGTPSRLESVVVSTVLKDGTTRTREYV